MCPRKKKLKRNAKDNPAGFIKTLTKFQESTPPKSSKNHGGSTDLTFHCSDGFINAHQMILALHSTYLKRMFLSVHSFEFAMIDWEKSIAQLTGRRASDNNVDIFLPDFTKDDLRRLLDCFYLGEMLISDEVQSLALKHLWKTLCIDSIRLSELEFSEVEVKKKPPTPVKTYQIPPNITPVKRTPNQAQNSPAKRSKMTQSPVSTARKVQTTPQKKRSPSPLPKAVSIRNSPAKDQKYQNFKCPACGALISLHGRQVNTNLTKFQMHMISHYQDSLFSDIPYLKKYVCPHSGKDARCQNHPDFKTRISFLSHLSMVHEEFYPRIARILKESNRFKELEEPLKKIAEALRNYPTLQFDLNNCPSQNSLTDEISVFEAYNEKFPDCSDEGYTCNWCDMKTSEQDHAILHQFLEHGLTFKNMPSLTRQIGVILSCQTCGFVTYSKRSYLAHIGHLHVKFKEILPTLSTNIKGPLKMGDSFNNQSIVSGNQMEEMLFSTSSKGILYECQKCKFQAHDFHSFYSHILARHPMPIISRCKDCQKSQVQYKVQMNHYKNHLCILETDYEEIDTEVHTVYLPMEDLDEIEIE